MKAASTANRGANDGSTTFAQNRAFFSSRCDPRDCREQFFERVGWEGVGGKDRECVCVLCDCVLCVCIVQKSCGQPESACESVSVGENSRKR